MTLTASPRGLWADPNADDEAWFRERPHREFRWRHLAAGERDDGDVAPPASGLIRLACVRRQDGAMVKAWTPRPDIVLSEEDEGRARFAAQGMPNPPDMAEPIIHIDFAAVAAPAEGSIRALADDALARGAIPADRHAAIVAEPKAHVLPQMSFADDGPAGPQIQVGAEIDPAFLAEIGLSERQQ